MSKLLNTAETDRKAYTISEIASLYGISTATLWRKVKSGELPVKRIGKRVIVLRQDWEKFVESNGAADGAKRG